MKKLMITAVTIAACGALFAETEKEWFDAVSDFSESNWTATTGVTKDGSTLTFSDADATYDTPAVADGDTPTAYVITANVKFTEENTDEVPDAKAGLRLTKSNDKYYFAYIGADGWVTSETEADANETYAITVLVGADAITYKVGEDTIGTKTLALAKPATCGFKGTGVMTSMIGKYTILDAVIPEVVPGEQIEVNTEAEAQTVEIALSDAQKAIGEGNINAYKAMFTRQVKLNEGTGKYDVTFVLTDAGKDALEAKNDTTVQNIMTTLAGDETSVAVKTVPGFYYSISQGTTPNALTEGPRTLATTDADINFTITKPEGAGFYQINVNTADNLVE